jgi:spore coat-associated protein N
MRAVATLIISLVMALGAIGLAVAAPGGHRLASAEIQDAGGAISISNSRAGQAVFSALDMRPGEGVSGTLQIGNDGDVAGNFAVRPSTVLDTPGPNGGLLSERIELVLFDVTDVAHPVTVYAGHPADFNQVGLGEFDAGEHRNYLFAATLPDGGAGDNAYQGSGLSLGFEWRASATPHATPTPTPTPTVTPTPTPTPTTPITPTTPTVDYATALGLPPAAKCAKGGKLKFKLKAPHAKVVSATVAVNGKVKLRVKGAKVRKPVTLQKLKKTFKVTVAVKASNKKTYKATRTYRVCGK